MVLCALSVARASPAAELLLEQGKALLMEGYLDSAIELITVHIQPAVGCLDQFDGVRGPVW